LQPEVAKVSEDKRLIWYAGGYELPLLFVVKNPLK
jgi:hypothetical protein